MRKVRLQESVNPSSYQSADDGGNHDRDSVAYKREQRPRTRSRKRPAQSENCAAHCISYASAHSLRWDGDWLAGETPYAQALDQGDGSRGRDDRGSQDEVHSRGLKAEHLLDTKPRDHFRLGDRHPEANTEQKIGKPAHLEDQREKEVSSDQPAREEADHCD
jgi:hypothetical protein